MHAAYSEAVRLLAAQSVHNNGSNRDNTETVQRWLDIGTGSGLLASLVAAATASTRTEVYACEGVNEVADVAAQTFQKNGERVRLFRGRSTEMEIGRDLPSRVPRVISELLGTGRSMNWFPSYSTFCEQHPGRNALAVRGCLPAHSKRA